MGKKKRRRRRRRRRRALTSFQDSEQEVTPDEVLAGDSDPCDPSLMESVSTSRSGGSSHMEKKRWSLRSFGTDGCKQHENAMNSFRIGSRIGSRIG